MAHISDRSLGKVSVEIPKSDPWEPGNADDRSVDIRIYVSPRAAAIAVTALVVVGRLIETLVVVLYDHL